MRFPVRSPASSLGGVFPVFFLHLLLTSFSPISTSVPEGQLGTHCSSPMGSLAYLNGQYFQWFLEAGLSLEGSLGSSSRMSLLTGWYLVAAASECGPHSSCPPPLSSSTSTLPQHLQVWSLSTPLTVSFPLFFLHFISANL